MPEIRGFSMPRDLPLCLSSMAKAAYWHRAVKRLEPGAIIPCVRRRGGKADLGREGIGRLGKRFRAASFLLIRVLRVKTPCLARSCAVYEYALRMGLDASMKIGAAKECEAIAGHAWVEIGGVPFMESEKALEGQTVMLEG
jgi:hypothetical protein